MKYYLIAGEASGDLHASHLMHALKEEDAEAEFRYYGGDMMAAEGGTLVQHYRDLAYMGFIPVLLHLRTILQGMKHCKEDIVQWQPDALILVDYPGFNLNIAKFIHTHTSIPVSYYISPKIWAWKEHRIKDIRRYVDHLYSILPFEVDFFEKKHHYPIDYVGNPTMDEVVRYKENRPQTDPSPHYHRPPNPLKGETTDESNVDELGTFCKTNGLQNRPIIALLAGSRKQEIAGNLSKMIEAARPFTNRYQLVLAGAPGMTPEDYAPYLEGVKSNLASNASNSSKSSNGGVASIAGSSSMASVSIVYGKTYDLLDVATAALVTSGTATLETALFRVPQVVCYWMRMGWLVSKVRPYFLKIPFISLVNLIANREVVPELVADGMTVENCRKHLTAILPGGSERQAQLDGYQLVADRLGKAGAPQHAVRLIIQRTKKLL